MTPSARLRRRLIGVLTLGLLGLPSVRAQEPKPVLAFAHTKCVFCARYSPDGTHIATSGKDQFVRLWDAAGRPVRALKGHTASVYGVAFSPDGRRLASVGADGQLIVWSVPGGEEQLKLSATRGEDLYAVAFSPDGRKIAAAGSGASVLVFAADKGTSLHQLRGHSGRVLGVAFSPDGRRLVSSCGTASSGAAPGGEVKVWDADKGEELMTLPGERNVLTVAFSPDGRRLAGACLDGTVKVWEMVTGQEAAAFKGHTLQTYTVAFSPDGRTLASCSGNWNDDKAGEVKLWDLAAGKEQFSFRGHTRPIWNVVFRPDSKRLLTATGAWDVEEAGEGREWEVPARGAEAVAAATPNELKSWWADLGAADARRAYRAVWSLSVRPKDAASFLDENARPLVRVDLDQKRLDQLILELDHSRFKVRENAQQELERLGRTAHPSLRKAMESPSAEVRRRARSVLDTTGGFEKGPPPLHPDELRLIRAIEVLQQIGTSQTKPTLERLAESKTSLPVAAEAALALAAQKKAAKP